MIVNDLAVPFNVVVWTDPDHKLGADDLQLILTYDGLLLGANSNNTRAEHKHELRKCFHKQLKRFWQIHPAISKISLQSANNPSQYYAIEPYLADRFERAGYNFIPLVSGFFRLDCSIHVMMLRQDPPGAIIKSGDLDNRLKTIFDALRMPRDKSELGKYLVPGDDEKPFYCLLEDDNLITKVSLEADTLLESVNPLQPHENDARLFIRVELKPYLLGLTNAVFA